MHHTQKGDPKKATDCIVDMVRSDGKTIPPRFPVGKDAIEKIRANCAAKVAICDEWEGFCSDTQFDPEQ